MTAEQQATVVALEDSDDSSKHCALADVSDEAARAVRKQVEFYFSDSNYRRDKFMRTQAALHQKGFIPIEILLKFNRLKSLTTDAAVIESVCRTSSDLIVSKEGKHIRRARPLPDIDTSSERTVYVKGFNTEAAPALDALLKFFGAHGNVAAVRLRYNVSKDAEEKSKDFKGSIFVEMKDDEAFKTFLESFAGEGKLKFEENELTIMSRKQWVESKKLRRKEAKEKSKEDEKQAAIAELESKEFEAGLIVKFEGVGEGVSRETLKAECDKYGVVKYIDFSAGDENGFIRFDTAEDAKKAIDALKTNNVEFGEKVPQWTSIEGDEEKQYWRKVWEDRLDRRTRKRPSFGGGRGRGRGGFKKRRT